MSSGIDISIAMSSSIEISIGVDTTIAIIIGDGVHPKIYPLISHTSMYQNIFIYGVHSTNLGLRTHVYFRSVPFFCTFD